jgi:hypothetical protein
MKTLLLLLLLLPGLAMAQAGRFLLAVGEVFVVRGAAETRAGIGTAVEAGDTIRVGPNSNAQVRFSDESIVGLRSGTVLRLDEYFFAGQADGRERSVFSLIKGGFRTVTGVIGRLQNRDRYAIRSPTSTIGIRGTHYTIVHCDNDCAPGVQNGTYGGVSDGRIGVVNQAADREFAANEFFYVADANSAPQSLIAPPSFLYDRLDGQQRTQGRSGTATSEGMAQSGLNAESRPSETPTPPAPQPFIVTEQRTASGSPTVLAGGGRTDLAFQFGLANGGFAFGQSHDFGARSSVVVVNNILESAGGEDCFPSCAPITLGRNGAAVADTGGDSTVSPVFWGRWVGGSFSGNPTTGAGVVGAMSAASFSVNFTAQQVSGSIQYAFPGNTYFLAISPVGIATTNGRAVFAFQNPSAIGFCTLCSPSPGAWNMGGTFTGPTGNGIIATWATTHPTAGQSAGAGFFKCTSGAC